MPYKNDVVKDLYYLIHSDSLIRSHQEITLFPQVLNDCLKDGLESICAYADTNNIVIQQLNQAKQLRLGKYCEELLAFYFNIHPEFKILEKNWQINREGITYGEVDFILQTNSKVFGLETSFKCYGQFDEGLLGWEGPKRKDSFIKKLDKVQSHQIPVFKSEEVLEKYGKFPAYFFVKGHLFGSPRYAKDSNFKEIEFQTINWSKTAQLNLKNRNILLFPKSAWISEIYFSNKHFEVSKQELANRLNEARSKGQSLILGVRSKNVFENYLIVED